MIRIQETTRTLPFYRPVPLTSLPLIYHREHLFPYTSYGDTKSTPTPRSFRMVTLENEFLRFEVAPELGGRVYSLFDKRIGREMLFSNPVVKPVRILPIWAFISGGMEFNFPIAHSPTSIAEVGCASGVVGNYGFIRVGEREARTGMEWAVELGLMGGCPALVQRTALRNLTGSAHPWMMWTICAVRSTQRTEFIHPPHRVLVHDHRVTESPWPGDGLNWDRNARQMTALFWKPGSSPQFGVFHHDLEFGLMHLADPAQLPGKKVWTYGHGKHRDWAEVTTLPGLAYAEIESGPLLDQSEKPLFPAGAEQRYEEFWMPVHSRTSADEVSWPKLDLPAWPEPWVGWSHSQWQSEWERFRAGDGPLPATVVPTGLELEMALRRELDQSHMEGSRAHLREPSKGAGTSSSSPHTQDSIKSGDEDVPAPERSAAEPLALWLAFRDRPEEALALVATSPHATVRRIAGLILWKGLNRPAEAVPHLEAGPLGDPVAVVELDELYAELGLNEERGALLAAAPNHRLVIERRADFAFTVGKPAHTLRLLNETAWPREHQRYVRTELWKKAKAALGELEADVPDSLNEDNLARFGAYWSTD